MVYNKRIQREKKTVEMMLKIYCQKKHHSQIDLCEECQTLKSYAYKRLDLCQFGENKPTCGKCTVHCYKQDRRQKMINIMKFSGPKMFYRHPLATLNHLLDGFKTPKNRK